MTCKECNHFEACLSFWHSDYGFMTMEEDRLIYGERTTCELFQPAADVETVRHGKWLEQYEGSRLLKCSVCGYEFCDLIECGNFCGNCGAKMGRERREV